MKKHPTPISKEFIDRQILGMLDEAAKLGIVYEDPKQTAQVIYLFEPVEAILVARDGKQAPLPEVNPDAPEAPTEVYATLAPRGWMFTARRNQTTVTFAAIAPAGAEDVSYEMIVAIDGLLQDVVRKRLSAILGLTLEGDRKGLRQQYRIAKRPTAEAVEMAEFEDPEIERIIRESMKPNVVLAVLVRRIDD